MLHTATYTVQLAGLDATCHILPAVKAAHAQHQLLPETTILVQHQTCSTSWKHTVATALP